MSIETVLGFTVADIHRVYRKGHRSPVERELRARFDVMLLELVRAGHAADELATTFGIERRRLSRALTRARVASGERLARQYEGDAKPALANRDGGAVCHYCGVRQRLHELTVDHVIPLARGGSNTRENKVLACRPCNGAKGSQVWTAA